MVKCSICGKSFDEPEDYERHIDQSHEAMSSTYSEVFCKGNERKNKNIGAHGDIGQEPSFQKAWGYTPSNEEGADDALSKVDDLSESWNTISTEEKAKVFESLGINQGSAYTLANLEWYNLSPQLKKDASEAYVKAEEEIVKCDVCNGRHKTDDHNGIETNEAYADFYNLEKNHQSPDYKKKALTCSRCNESFKNKTDRDVHFNEFHATEQEYNLPEECPLCNEQIKEPETLDWHMEQEHGAHVPSQYTQTGIQGAMADFDFDRLDEAKATEAKWECLDCDSEFDDAGKHQEETGHHNIIKKHDEKATEGWYVLTLGDDLWHYDTREEAEKAVKNFPAGTYQIGEESKANEDDMDDLQYRQQFGHDWWDDKARKERLKREGKADESKWKVHTISQGDIDINLGKEADETDAINAVKRMYFDEGFIEERDILGASKISDEAIDGHSPEEMIKREHELMGEQPEPKEQKIHTQLKKEFGDEEGFWDDPNNFELDVDKYLDTGDIEKKSDEGHHMEHCTTCGKVVSDLEKHMKEEHGEE